MRLVAIFDKFPKHDPVLTGNWHYLNLDGGAFLFVCEPRDYTKAETHLEGLGAHVFPDLVDGVPVEILQHKAMTGVGLGPNDTGHTARKKLHAHFGWPKLDPRR